MDHQGRRGVVRVTSYSFGLSVRMFQGSRISNGRRVVFKKMHHGSSLIRQNETRRTRKEHARIAKGRPSLTARGVERYFCTKWVRLKETKPTPTTLHTCALKLLIDVPKPDGSAESRVSSPSILDSGRLCY